MTPEVRLQYSPSEERAALQKRLNELEEENQALRARNQELSQEARTAGAFSDLINNFPMLIFRADPDGNVHDLGEFAKARGAEAEAFAKARGAEAEAYDLGRDGWMHSVHPEERAVAESEWRASIQQGIPFEAEYRIRRDPNSGFRWHWARAVPVRNSSGGIIQWFGAILDVHRARELEQALRDGERRLLQAQQAAAIGSWEWDLETNLVRWSDEIYRMLRIPLSEPSRFENWLQRIVPEDREGSLAETRRAIDAGIPLIDEFRMLRGDGEVRWVQSRAQVVDTPEGGRRMIGAVIDITDRKLTEQSLHESEARFRSIFDTVAAGMALAEGPAGCMIAVNPTLAGMTGYAVEELTGKTLLELTHPADRDAARSAHEQLLSGEVGVYVLEKRLVRKDHASLWVRVTASAVKDVEGLPRRSVAIIEDISERRQSERISRAIGDSIPYGIWITDAAGRNIYGSQSFFDLTGMTQQECNQLGWTHWLHPEDARNVVPEWLECVRTGKMFDSEMRWRGQDGEYHPALVRGGPVRDEMGEITAWAGINLDIAALKQAELELRAANADLEQFAYAASHDLREPLRTVTTYAQLLAVRYGDRLDANGKQFLNFIVGGATRMQSLVNDLLAYARVIHSPNTPDDTFQLVALGRVFDDVVAGLGSSIDESGAQIFSDPMPEVMGDATQLAQLFQNLLSNAIKYRRKEVPLTIHLGVKLEDGNCLFCFEDNGMGFDPVYAERIFRVFKRLHGVEIPGTGIGLAICRKIVERHYGRIWAESKPGEGATFCFTLPCRGV